MKTKYIISNTDTIRSLNVFLCILIFSLQGISQFTRPSKVKEYLSLKDEVNLLCLFVSTDHGEWEEDEKEAYYKTYLAAQEWILEEAEFYGVDLYFNNDQFHFDNKRTIFIDNISMKHRPGHTLHRVMRQLDYYDSDEFLEENNFDLQEKKLKIVLLVKQNSRSHAFNYWSVEELDLAIVYCRNSFGMMTDKYVIAHEILHQFGAWDLYFGQSQTIESAKKADELYPNSVMIRGNVVDELTAWRIGWAEHDESFDFFDPKKNRETALKQMQDLTGKKSSKIEFKLGKKKEKDKDN